MIVEIRGVEFDVLYREDIYDDLIITSITHKGTSFMGLLDLDEVYEAMESYKGQGPYLY